MKFRVLLKRSAQKELQKLDKAVAKRILAKIYLLSEDPYPSASTLLVGSTARRLRVGNHRVIYEVLDSQLVIHVIRVGHRREVYRK
jgi:mRNA interferase RelE/StbE